MEATTAGGYRGLAHVRGYPGLLSAVFLARLANSMSQVGVVIYLIERTGSPVVAGAAAAAQTVPGVLSGPFLGAWLDRRAHRSDLIAATQLVRALVLGAVVALGELADPAPAVYVVLLAGLGLTFPLPTSGFRSLIPILVPRRLWDQANAADSMTFDASFIVGPALAGAMVTWVGAPAAVLAQAGVMLLGGAVSARVHEPAGRARSEEPAGEAILNGLRAVFLHPTLRATIVLMIVSGIGLGTFTIGLPLWARDHLGHSAGAAGWLWAALSTGSLLGGLTYGARRPRGSDARHVVLFTALYGVPLLFLPAAPSLAAAMAIMFTAGIFSAPFIIAMFGMRQRALPPELHGRAFAITISLNVAGTPIGAFLAGLAVRPLGPGRLLLLAGIAQLAAACAGSALLLAARRRRLAKQDAPARGVSAS